MCQGGNSWLDAFRCDYEVEMSSVLRISLLTCAGFTSPTRAEGQPRCDQRASVESRSVLGVWLIFIRRLLRASER